MAEVGGGIGRLAITISLDTFQFELKGIGVQ